MVMMVNLVFAGNFEEKSAEKLAAIGLGNMLLGMLCRHFMLGINCAIETLSSQAFGQRQLQLCGVYLNRGRFIMTAIYLPLAVMLIFSK